MSAEAEIGEICRVILAFENDIEPLRQKFFYAQPHITKNSLWGYIIGHKHDKLFPSQLSNFSNKHGRNIKRKSIETICSVYSSFRDQTLSCQDLWNIVQPKTLKHLDSVLKHRERNELSLKLPHISYSTIDFFIQILERTIEFQQTLEKMRKNIPQQQQFVLSKLTPTNLQAKLSLHVPDLHKKEWQIIFDHIIRKSKNKIKKFYAFFLSNCPVVSKTNPNKSLTLKQPQNEEKGLEFASKKQQLYSYGFSQGKKRPLYLI